MEVDSNEEVRLENGREMQFPLNDESIDSMEEASQQTNYSQFGVDITPIMLAFNPTQSSEEKPPDSATSSETSLGKRKASDISSGSGSSFGDARPLKVLRPIDPDDPFVNKLPQSMNPEEDSENSAAPIRLSPEHIILNNMKKLPYGVQYEIIRYCSLGLKDLKDVDFPLVFFLLKFDTNMRGAPRVADALLRGIFRDEEDEKVKNDAFAKENAAKSPWAELDREEAALKDNPYGGLGFTKEGKPLNWHGGQVLFHGKLIDGSAKNTKPVYRIKLEPPEIGPSNMFARRFGSKYFFRLKVTKAVMNKNSDRLLNYLRRPIILCGHVFRAFYAKDANVFYVKTNECLDGDVAYRKPVPGVMSFLEFLDWHNPIAFNNKQTMAKFVSRFGLGLSNSVPGLLLDSTNIRFIDDIISETGSNMTDGAGKINRWSLKQLRHRLNWEDMPTAIQTRIFGTKGLLVEDRANAEEFGYVELTPSQQKIHFPEGEVDPAHRIIDVLRASHVKSPCRLSVETIVCLAENGVSKKVFLNLLKKSLEDLVKPLLEWEGPGAMKMLWSNVRRLSGVMNARRAREDVGLARVKGYIERDNEDSEVEDEFILEDASEVRSLPRWNDETSGCPASLEETIMCMIDSGFEPKDCPVLKDNLYKFVKGRVSNYIKTYRIDVPMSATAFLVPDTYSVLEPGQIFFKSSRRQFITPDGLETDVYVGPVLVTRHPCKLPTDIQKWVSVDVPEFHHLTDVIVLSTKGNRRAADFLAGGDHDGDKGLFLYQPELVNAFTNAPEIYSEPPAYIKKDFSTENEEVETFRQKIKSLSEESQIRSLQKYLLGAIRDPAVVGKYSTYHEIATYTLGYRHPETIRLAYMFCMTLDGIKTGMTVAPDILKSDAQKFHKRLPAWKETDEDRDRSLLVMNNEANVTRPSNLPRFIMDDLHTQAKKEGDRWLTLLHEHFIPTSTAKLDDDLSFPWQRAMELGKKWEQEENRTRYNEDLNLLKVHVEKVYNDHRTEMSSPRKPKNSPKKGGPSFTDLPIAVRQDKIRELSAKFTAFPAPNTFLMGEEEVARIRASYAYVYDYEQRKNYGSYNYTRFPFDVGMRELCAIKARALGRFKVVHGEFYDHFNLKHPKNHHF